MKTHTPTTMKHAGKRCAALVLSLLMAAMCLTTAMPAYAANVPPSGEQMKTTFDKYLVMDAGTNVPNAEFEFTIEAGSAVNGSGSKPSIYAGIGTPTVEKAEFTTADSTTEGLPTAASGSVTAEKKYATDKVTVDFTGISFLSPGIYRYIITEIASTQDGIENDSTTTRTLDVYVGYENDSDTNLEVMGYTMYLGTVTDADNLDTNKSNGFTNTYQTSDLTLEKKVSGNQGDRDMYFEFTVSITGAVPGTVYSVDNSNASYSDDPADPTELTVGADGSISGTFHLKHKESIKIQGLTSAVKYSIEEKDYTEEGYTTSHKIDSGSSVDSRSTGEQIMGTEDHSVTFTNRKGGIVPTGIILETAPYLLLGAVVIVGFVALTLTKKRRKADDRS